MKTLSFNCLVAKQSPTSSVVSFVTNAEDIEKIFVLLGLDEMMPKNYLVSNVAKLVTISRDSRLFGKRRRVLPNAIILAFTKGVELKLNKDGKSGEIIINVEPTQVGLIVDGQQRYSALRMLEDKKFEVFVSALICKDEDELQAIHSN